MIPPIFLASASPRRSQLLRELGVPFEVAVSNFEEPPPNAEEEREPALYVEKLARRKAEHCAARGLVIAADTVVELEGAILNKPRDPQEAVAMLKRLRGKTHRVLTGVCVRNGEKCHVEHETTRVTFGDFSDDFIARYVATGEPSDKAGAYAAQGKGALLILKLEGDYWNVVGLPLARLARMLARFGVKIENFWI